MEADIKNLSTIKSPGAGGLSAELYQTSNKGSLKNSSNYSSKGTNRRNIAQFFLTRPQSL